MKVAVFILTGVIIACTTPTDHDVEPIPTLLQIGSVELHGSIEPLDEDGPTLQIRMRNNGGDTTMVFGLCPYVLRLYDLAPTAKMQPVWTQRHTTICPAIQVHLRLGAGQDTSITRELRFEKSTSQAHAPPPVGEYYAVLEVNLSEPTRSVMLLLDTARIRIDDSWFHPRAVIP